MSDEPARLVWANEGGRRMQATGNFEALCWLARRSSEKGGGAMLFKGETLRMVFINGAALWDSGEPVNQAKATP